MYSRNENDFLLMWERTNAIVDKLQQSTGVHIETSSLGYCRFRQPSRRWQAFVGEETVLEAETTNAKKLAQTEIFYDGLDRTINEIQEKFSSQTSKILMVLCDIIKNNNPKESFDIVAEFYLIDKAILNAEK